LMVSMKCYHRMCTSCIDRIFTLGPAKCPIPLCNTTLRAHEFKVQTFGDLGVEREVGIRRSISGFLNKREEDFASLREYNDYLEFKEDITFNLFNDIELAETNRKILKWKRDNEDVIVANEERGEWEREESGKREEDERKAKEDRRKQLEKEQQDEEQAKEEEKRRVLGELESGTASTSKIIAQSKANALKRSSMRTSAQPPSTSSHTFSSLSKAKTAEPDPFSSSDRTRWDSYDALFTLEKGYHDELTEKLAKAPIVQTGGWDVQEHWERAVRSSVMGLWMKPREDLNRAAKVDPVTLEL